MPCLRSEGTVMERLAGTSYVVVLLWCLTGAAAEPPSVEQLASEDDVSSTMLLARMGWSVNSVKSGASSVCFSADGGLIASSHDDGQSFSAAKQIARVPGMNLGMHRGPRIVITPRAMVITAVNGKTDGNLLAWRSYDGGNTWAGPVTVNDKPKSADEGLQGMGAGPGGLIYSVWLDHRTEQAGKQLYGAYSTDDGKTWSKNILIYHSPSGTICQCCHPSLTFGANGDLHVMFRNAIEGIAICMSPRRAMAVRRSGRLRSREQDTGNSKDVPWTAAALRRMGRAGS